MFETISLLRRGDLDLNEYSPALEIFHSHGTVLVGDRVYDYFPSGIVFLGALPIWILSRIYGYGYLEANAFAVELTVASLLCAMAALLFFRAARQKYSLLISLGATLILALDSSVLSTASRALWQSTGIVFLTCASLALIARLDRTEGNHWQLAGLGGILALAFVVRPLSIVWSAPTAAYLLHRYRNWQSVLLLAMPALMIGILFLAFNQAIYHRFLPPYYNATRVFDLSVLAAALPGNLASPARGIFIWSPVFLGSGVGTALVLARRDQKSYFLPASLAILLHLLLISTFPHWWGGHSLGPRLQTEIAPLYAWLLLPFLDWVSARRSAVYVGCFALLAAISIAIHLRAAFVVDVNLWNTRPDVNEHPERIWSWRSAQFLAGNDALRFLFKQQ
ncbi:MAG: hypothetical protein K1X75_11905 [Leptospirales bacterium]|nr:hypothetical protein [Leptospirales bacterium]